MSDVPGARRALLKVYKELRAAGLHQYADKMVDPLKQLHREPPIRRAGIRHPPVTAEIRDGVRAYAKAHPKAHFTSIARAFNTNPGRVSEIMNGKYDHL